MNDLAFVRLLQLVSPALPVGAFSYSAGLEQAVDAGIVRNEAEASRWIGDALKLAVARWEAPAVALMIRAWQADDDEAVQRLDREFLASRESAELRAETLQMGHSLARLLRELHAFDEVPHHGERLSALREPAYPTVWAAAMTAFAIPAEMALRGYLWAWLENQVLAAVKLVPLGQSAGQRVLADVGAHVPALAREALACEPASWCNWTPGLALASAAHETQYSRLFRS